MKRITPAILTAFSVLALSLSVTSFADNTDSDGFIVFGAPTTETTEQNQAASTDVAEQSQTTAETAEEVAKVEPKAKEKAVKKVKKAKKAKNKPRKRAKRAVRKKRATRTTRAKRNNNLRRASSYRVRKGDTLYRISVNSGVKLSRLARLNNLQGSKKHNIQAGQRIRLR